jgi:hypothetical protein
MTRILLPGSLVRHIADVGDSERYQEGVWYPLVRLCDRSMRLAGDLFIAQNCEGVESADLTDSLVCPACLAAHQPADTPDPTMGTIPLFDLS